MYNNVSSTADNRKHVTAKTRDWFENAFNQPPKV